MLISAATRAKLPFETFWGQVNFSGHYRGINELEKVGLSERLPLINFKSTLFIILDLL